MLITGSIGIAMALGQWLTAVGATALALSVLRGAALIERRLSKKANRQ